ncbi:MAG: thiolase family protein [Candidatus Saccharibacteria bacterium]|nr:thiolase family protein [Pseudorhodobacter sp.]
MTAFVVAACRTAVVPRGGTFAGLSLSDLAVPVVQACLTDAGIAGAQVDEVVVSNALGGGGNVARLVSLAAGLPDRVAGLTIDRQCAGGLDAVLLARALVDSGAAEVVVAGGVESYSRRPLRFRTDPAGGAALAYDRPAFTPWPDRDPEMHDAAAALAERLGITRAEQDAWAVNSHAKALRADFAGEIVALNGCDRDVFARGLTLAVADRAKVLAGSVTMATAAVAADAAAFVVVVSQARAAGLRRARIVGGVTRGGRPEDPGLAPLVAMAEVLHRAGLTPRDLQVAEVMEAYAVQALACIRGAGIDPARVNPGGGALARGHPIGASGAILAVRLFHALRGGYGLAAIAAAGGIGTALLLHSD